MILKHDCEVSDKGIIPLSCLWWKGSLKNSDLDIVTPLVINRVRFLWRSCDAVIYTHCKICLFIRSQPEFAQESAPCKYVTFKQFSRFQTNEFSTITSTFLNILTGFSSQFKIYNILWINVAIFINIRVLILIPPNPFGSRRFVTSKCKNDFFKSVFSYQWICNVLLVLLGVCLMQHLIYCVWFAIF